MRRYDDAVTPVIATILVVMIVVSVTAAIMIWGMPMIEQMQMKAEKESILNQVNTLDESINNLIYNNAGTVTVDSFVLGKDSEISIDEETSRSVVSYALADGYDCVVTGLDDMDTNTLNIEMAEGSITREEVIWFDDSRTTCFLAGTQVLLADRTFRNIEDVAVGDRVLSYDISTRKNLESVVTQVFPHEDYEMTDYYLIINDDLEVTPNHRFYSNNGWVFADELRVGDFLFDGEKNVVVDSIIRVFEKNPSFDLEVATYHNYFVKINDDVVLVHNDELDQSQTTEGVNSFIYGTRWYGQSFKPTYKKITKVELYLKKLNSPTASITVSVRNSLTGSDLTSTTVAASSLTTSYDWILFDFADITVTPGSTYYIICRLPSGSLPNIICWAAGSNDPGGPYADGSFWYSPSSGSSGWLETTTQDFCFKTYGEGITVTTPSSSTNWQRGTTQDIEWTSTDVGNVDITYLKNDVYAGDVILSTTDDGSHSWNIPDLTPGDGYQIKIMKTGDSNVYDLSDYFTIYSSPDISVTNPESSDSWEQGTTNNIEWTYSGPPAYIENIILINQTSLSETTIFNKTADGDLLASAETRSWTVPLSQTPGDNYEIYVETNTSIFNNSETFTIAEGVPTLSYNPHEYDCGTLNIGEVDSTTFEIWNSRSGTLNWAVTDYSTAPNWVNVTDIDESGTSTGEHDTIHISINTAGLDASTYSYEIPILKDGTPIGDIFYVNVTTQLGPALSYAPTSNSLTMKINEVQNITFQIWNSGIDTLTYILSETEDWITMNSSGGESTGPTDIDTISVQINTSSTYFSTMGQYTCDITIDPSVGPNKLFTISLTIADEVIDITQPSGGEQWMCGAKENITWSYPEGGTGSLNISLFKDGAFHSNIANNVNNVDGMYTWNIPYGLATGSNYFIRIVNESCEGFYGNSSYFSIKGSDGSQNNYTFNIVINQGESYDLTLPTGNTYSGTCLVDFWDDNSDLTTPAIRIWIFDTDTIKSKTVTSEGTDELKIVNGGCLYSSGGDDYEIKNAPRTYIKADSLGFRAVQLVKSSDSLSSGSGGSGYKYRLINTLWSSYRRDIETVYNLSISFFGEDADKWHDYYNVNNPGKFLEENNGLSFIPSRDENGCGFDLMHSIVVIKLQ